MTIEKTRAQIMSKVWQAFAQSEVDLTSLPQAEQEKLAGSITDNMLKAMDEFLDDVDVEDMESVDEHSETILWEGRPFLSLVEKYVLTNERLKVVQGFFGRKTENFELIRIQDIDFEQAVGERMLNLGDITVRGHDTSNATIILRNVSDPEEVYETLRRAWLNARKTHGLQFREEM